LINGFEKAKIKVACTCQQLVDCTTTTSYPGNINNQVTQVNKYIDDVFQTASFDWLVVVKRTNQKQHIFLYEALFDTVSKYVRSVLLCASVINCTVLDISFSYVGVSLEQKQQQERNNE